MMTTSITLNEPVNLEVCQKLTELTFKQFLDLLGHSDGDKQKTQYNLIMKYCRNALKSNGNLQVTYEQTKASPHGRLQAIEPSLQRINSKIRGILSDGVTKDYDMVNAAPTLLLYLAKKHDLYCPNVEDYVRHRDQRLAEFMDTEKVSRATAKEMFIISLNDCRCRTHVNKKQRIKPDSFFIRYDKEVKDLQKKIAELYPEDRRRIRKRSGDNISGRLLGDMLCQLENTVLQLATKGKQVTTYIFDGFQTTEDYSIEELNHTTSVSNVKWAHKEFDISLYDALFEIDTSENSISYVGSDIRDIAVYLLNNVIKGKICYCEGKLYFYKGTHWASNEKESKRALFNLISNYDLWLEIDGKYKSISTVNQHIKDVREFIIEKAPVDDTFVSRVWDSTKRKLYFANGYLDFELNKFITTGIRDTFIYIHRDYNPKSDPKIRQEIYDRILNPIFSTRIGQEQEQLRDNFLYNMGRVMAGDVEMKKWFTMEGLKNTGKGVLSDGFSNTFGPYVRTINAGNFTYKKFVGDEAKQQSYLMDLQFARLAVSQEISLKEEGQTYMDGNKMKMFVSGGDTQCCRQNFQDEQQIRLQAAFMMCCNDRPLCKPADITRELIPYIMKSKFIDYTEESEEFSNIDYYPKDDTVKSKFIKQADVQNEFAMLIFEHYTKPVRYPSAERELAREDGEDDVKKLVGLFEFSGATKDKISYEEIRCAVECNKIPFQMRKTVQLLIGKGAKRYKSNGKHMLMALRFKE